jgi:hypothetical protein
MEGSCVTSAAASRKDFSNTNLSSSAALYLWGKKKKKLVIKTLHYANSPKRQITKKEALKDFLSLLHCCQMKKKGGRRE